MRVTRVRIICWVAFLTSFFVMVLTTSTLSLDTVIDGAPCSSLGYVMRKSYISSMVYRPPSIRARGQSVSKREWVCSARIRPVRTVGSVGSR